MPENEKKPNLPHDVAAAGGFTAAGIDSITKRAVAEASVTREDAAVFRTEMKNFLGGKIFPELENIDPSIKQLLFNYEALLVSQLLPRFRRTLNLKYSAELKSYLNKLYFDDKPIRLTKTDIAAVKYLLYKYYNIEQNEPNLRPPQKLPDENSKKLEDQEKVQDTFSASANPKDVGEMLARLRTSLSLTKVEAAAAMGKGEGTVRAIESGAHSQTLNKVGEYADALGYKVRIELIPKGSD